MELPPKSRDFDLLNGTDVLHCITRGEMISSTAPSTKTAHVPAHLRSTKLPTPKASIAPKVTALLAELGVSHVRLVMPTRENIQHLEALLDAAAVLIDTKKSVDRIDQEIRTHKKLLDLDAGEDGQAEAAADGEGEDDSGGERAGDAGTAEESAVADVVDGDREQSVAATGFPSEGPSSKQVRASICFCVPFFAGRKVMSSIINLQNHKRSLSLSSVETSATAATRASRSNKRTRVS